MMSIYPAAVGYWLATAQCLCFWPFFSLFFFCFAFLKSRGFVQGPGIVEIGEDGVIFWFCSFFFLFLFNCTILARLSVGTLGFIKLDTILYRSYFDITTRLWGLDCRLQCGNTLNLIAQNATTGFCYFSIDSLVFFGCKCRL